MGAYTGACLILLKLLQPRQQRVSTHVHTPQSKFKLHPSNLVAFRSKAKTFCPHFIFHQQQLGIAEKEDGKNKATNKGRNWQNT